MDQQVILHSSHLLGTTLQFTGVPAPPHSSLSEVVLVATDMTWCRDFIGNLQVNDHVVLSFNETSTDANCSRLCQNCRSYSFQLSDIQDLEYSVVGVNTMELNVISGKVCFVGLVLDLVYDQAVTSTSTCPKYITLPASVHAVKRSSSPSHSLLIMEIVIPIAVALVIMIVLACVIISRVKRHQADDVIPMTTWMIKNVVVLDRLGGGQFGDVYLGVLDVRWEQSMTL